MAGLKNDTTTSYRNDDGVLPQNKTVEGGGGEEEGTENATEDLRWGWRSFRPRILQCMNCSPGLLVFLSVCGAVYGMAVNGFNVAAITSLEKRFHLNSKQTGLITSMSDVSSMIVTIVVSFYGSFGNKPRWMALCLGLVGASLILFTMPHFMIGKYQPPEAKFSSQFCQEKKTTNVSADDSCEGDSVSFSWSYFIVFLIAQIMAGAGGAPLYCLGIAYLDENVNPKRTPIYIAVYYATGFVGPSLGFIIAGQLLSTYVDITQPEGSKLTPFDPQWIGNWWLGSLVSGFVIFILAFFLVGFPPQLPRARARREQAIKNQDIPGVNKKISGKIKDIIPATRNLLFNPVFMFQTLGVWTQVLVGAGVGPFLFKLVRTHYGATQALAGVGVGMIGGVSSVCGTLIGSFYGRKTKLKESCNVAAKYCFYFQLFGMWMTFMFLLPGCEDIEVPLTNSSYHNLVSKCNCDSVKYIPVCSDGVTYYSACHAGCLSQNVSSKSYANCSFTSWSENKSTRMKAKLGVCDRHCKNLAGFLVGFTLLLSLTYLNDVPGRIVTIRSVSENQRSYALGFQIVLWRLLGSLPGPVIFGSFLDGACILWRTSCGEKGDCLEYNTKELVFVIIFASMIVQALSLFFFALCWYFTCKSTFMNEAEGTHSNGKESGPTLLEQNGTVIKDADGINGVDNLGAVDKIIAEENGRRSVEETKL